MKKNKKEILYWGIVILIFIIVISVRLYKFGEIPNGVNQDEAMAAVDAKAIADYGTDRYGMYHPVHLTGWGYSQMSALLSYLIALFIKIFGFNIFAIRMLTLIISIIALIFLFLLSKDIFGKKVALITLFLGAINPWQIMQSRWALEANLFPHFFIISFYFLNKYCKDKNKIYLIISMILFGVCMYCYGVAIYTIPLFLLVAAIYLYKHKKVKMKDIVLSCLVYLAICWPFILTMAINYFKIDTINLKFITIPLFSESIRANDIIFFSNNVFKQLILNLFFTFRIIFQFKDLPWNAIQQFGTMYLFSMIFMILGGIILYKERKNENVGLLLIYLFASLGCGLITNYVNVNRLNIIFYFLIIINSVGLNWIITRFVKLKYFLITIYVFSFIMFINIYFNNYSKLLNKYYFVDFISAVSSIKNSNADKFYITVDTQTQKSKDVSEILTLFSHKLDAKYFQNKIVDEDGNYYQDKYNYINLSELDINYDERAEYIISKKELQCFDNNQNYKYREYGDYYVVSIGLE